MSAPSPIVHRRRMRRVRALRHRSQRLRNALTRAMKRAYGNLDAAIPHFVGHLAVLRGTSLRRV